MGRGVPSLYGYCGSDAVLHGLDKEATPLSWPLGGAGEAAAHGTAPPTSTSTRPPRAGMPDASQPSQTPTGSCSAVRSVLCVSGWRECRRVSPVHLVGSLPLAYARRAYALACPGHPEAAPCGGWRRCSSSSIDHCHFKSTFSTNAFYFLLQTYSNAPFF